MKNTVNGYAAQAASIDNACLNHEQFVAWKIFTSRWVGDSTAKPGLNRLCIDCSDPIALRRLALMPESSRCIECQTEFEATQQEEARITDAQQTFHAFETQEAEESDEDEAYLRSRQELDEESPYRPIHSISSHLDGLSTDLSQCSMRHTA